MSLRLYLLIMSVLTVLCWLAFGYIVSTVNPETTNWLGMGLFYLSLFMAVSGSAAIIGFLIRFVFLRHELMINRVIAAFRQSFLFAGFMVMALFLSSRGLLTWLNLIILIFGLSALEFFLLSYNRTDQPDDSVEKSAE